MKENKLIAVFMELPTEVFKSGKLNYYFREFNSGSWYEEHELSYNVSWDWLMTVVEKIYQLDSNANFFGSINLEATYKEVVEFIKQYNK